MLQMGGATLSNVVVMIFDDARLRVGVGKHTYQINAILGYPVFQALGAITFWHDGEFTAGDAAQRSSTGARMYMQMLRSIVMCGVEGKDLPFRFDTGAVGTQLQVRYYELFHGEIGSWKEGEEINSGVGGAVRRKIFIQPKLDLMVGDKTATLKDVTILPVKLNSDLDEFYGNLGQDFVAGFAASPSISRK